LMAVAGVADPGSILPLPSFRVFRGFGIQCTTSALAILP
jgi:hypothetical protein